jgi:DTW domain-containing protein YfiP
MRHEFCLCENIQKTKAKLLNVQTRIIVLMHHREEKLPTNTARLANLILPKCEIRLRGQKDRPLEISDLAITKNTYLLYPSDSSRVLTQDFVNIEKINGPINLVVPDGSWRQASKVAKRESNLAQLPKVMLPFDGPATEYKLRHEPKEGGLATFEAMARALGFIEGKLIEDNMIELFLLMVKRTLLSRRGILIDK